MVALPAQWTIDVRDLDGMARFWSAALGYRVDPLRDGFVRLVPPGDLSGGETTVLLQRTGATERGKNPVHPDLVAADGDVDKELARLLELGARRVHIGQTGDEPFTVLADPEGNEFCLLHGDPRRHYR